jgi:hypothetical protein
MSAEHFSSFVCSSLMGVPVSARLLALVAFRLQRDCPVSKTHRSCIHDKE